jgi:hypothetical protein
LTEEVTEEKVKDLVLKIRLGSLESNLNTLSNVLESSRERRREITQLTDLLFESRHGIEAVVQELAKIRQSVDDLRLLLQPSTLKWQTGYLDGIRTAREVAETKASEVEKTISDASFLIRDIKARSVNLEDLQDNDPEFKLVENARLEIENSANRFKNQVLRHISEDLAAARCSDKAKAEEKMKDAWKKYAEMRLEMVNRQHVFEGYVDFLHGLAMRDAELDAGICRIADDLIRRIVRDRAAQSLTIPSSQEPANVTLAGFIHFGFPEWTLWALPLTTHELGHVVVSKSSELSQFLEKDAPRHQSLHWEEFMADAFATYTMGPAYAFACILLRFEPPSAYEDRRELPSDAKRAQMIFKILEMNNTDGRYDEIIKQLKEEWKAALEQAKGQTKEISQIIQEGENQPEQLVNLLKEKDYLQFLEIATYPSAGWSRANRLKNFLLNEDKKILENLDKVSQEDWKGALMFDDEYRDVLNAAWLCRIVNLEKTEEIHRAALALWKGIEDRRQQPQYGREPRSAGAGKDWRL